MTIDFFKNPPSIIFRLCTSFYREATFPRGQHFLTVSHWKWMSKTVIELFFKTLQPIFSIKQDSAHPSPRSSQAEPSSQMQCSDQPFLFPIRHKTKKRKCKCPDLIPKYLSMNDQGNIFTSSPKSTTPTRCSPMRIAQVKLTAQNLKDLYNYLRNLKLLWEKFDCAFQCSLTQHVGS